MKRCKSLGRLACVSTVLAVASVTMAAERGGSVSGLLDLQSASAIASPVFLAAQEETTMTSSSTQGYDLGGPYFLRSADPLPVGEMEFKFVYGYETSSDESDDHEVEIDFEWGIAENIEFILEAEAIVGDGKIEGNGDITELGFHTRFWEENGYMPAFAMRNLVRLPTGYHSSGVDYTAIGLFTWTLDPGATRLHFNPYLTSLNGDNDDDDDDDRGFLGRRRFGRFGPFGRAGRFGRFGGLDEDDQRDFQWGAAIGVDHQVSDDLNIIIDYKHTSSENEGARNNHSIEFGGEWSIAPDQRIGFGTEFGIDGDENGPNFSARVSYIIEVG